jgi:hypothetical protein
MTLLTQSLFDNILLVKTSSNLASVAVIGIECCLTQYAQCIMTKWLK